jgi:hypothetical protein
MCRFLGRRGTLGVSRGSRYPASEKRQGTKSRHAGLGLWGFERVGAAMGMVVAAMVWAHDRYSVSERGGGSAFAEVPAGFCRWAGADFPSPGPHGAIGGR